MFHPEYPGRFLPCTITPEVASIAPSVLLVLLMPRAIILPRSIILSLTILLPRALLPLHFPSSYPPLPPLVIHEFDPWFNYRATEYYDEHGPEKFFKWFDYMSWYPLGRPVGTTIYPGLQVRAMGVVASSC